MDRRRRDQAIDFGLCAAMVAYALPPMLDPRINDPGATVAGPLLLPALLAPVLLRRRHPLAAACTLAVGCVMSGIPTFNQFRFIVAVPVALLVLFPLATSSGWRTAIAGLAAVLAGLAFVGATDAVLDSAVQLVAFAFPLAIGVWALGRMAWSRQRVIEQLTERSVQLRRQREATAALAVEIDRDRLALDLDLAARSRLQEMIALASGSGVDAASGRARFSRIEALGRESLDQMRALLGLLRNADRGARAPRPTLEQLDALLAEARAGGRVIGLEVDGERRALAAAIELAAYRVVQHALVALDDEPATVQVRYLPDELELEVRGLRIDGSAPGVALLAAHERVSALGGSFSAESLPRGRRVLRARLPAVPAGA